MFFRKKNKIDDNIIMKEIYNKGKIVRYAQFLLGIMLVACAFNIFLLSNDVVYGVGGIGVILNKTQGINPSIVVLVSSLILLVLSLFLLGKEETKKSIIGSLLYPLFIELTVPLVQYVDLGHIEIVVQIVFGAAISGLGLGLIFKSGFTTGGTDILNQIFAKYFKTSMGKAMLFTDGVIILVSLFIFGFEKFIYSLINMYIISIIADKVVLGISKSKAFYIITDNETSIKKFILNHLSHGVTVLEGRGGYTGNNQKVIMCIVPTKEYFIAKEGIHAIDPNAFFLVTDAYEVYGGE